MGPLGLWTGFPLHFVRDTLGTALYFAEYDVMRFWLGGGRGAVDRRQDKFGSATTKEDLPSWARGWLPAQLVPFLCGSLAGVTSWALIYPVDVSAQQREWLTRRRSRPRPSSVPCPASHRARRIPSSAGSCGGRTAPSRG